MSKLHTHVQGGRTTQHVFIFSNTLLTHFLPLDESMISKDHPHLSLGACLLTFWCRKLDHDRQHSRTALALVKRTLFATHVRPHVSPHALKDENHVLSRIKPRSIWRGSDPRYFHPNRVTCTTRPPRRALHNCIDLSSTIHEI